MRKIKIVYVAGPFSPTKKQKPERAESRGLGDKQFHRMCVEENIYRASLLGLEVAKIGLCPMIPHANTALPEFEDVQPYQFWIEATKEQLRRCDAVIFADGWQDSGGSVGEHELAMALAMPIFKTIDDLKTWADLVA